MAEEPKTAAQLLEKEIEMRQKELKDLELKILQLAGTISRIEPELIAKSVSFTSREWTELVKKKEELSGLNRAYRDTEYAIEALQDKLAQATGREAARAAEGAAPAIGARGAERRGMPALPRVSMPGAEAREERKISRRAARAEEMGVPIAAARRTGRRVSGGMKKLWENFGSLLVVAVGIGTFFIIASLWGSLVYFGGASPYMTYGAVFGAAFVAFVLNFAAKKKAAAAFGVAGVPGGEETTRAAAPEAEKLKFKGAAYKAFDIYKGLRKKGVAPMEAFEETKWRATGVSPDELGRLRRVAEVEQRVEVERMAKKEKGRKPEAEVVEAELAEYKRLNCPKCGEMGQPTRKDPNLFVCPNKHHFRPKK